MKRKIDQMSTDASSHSERTADLPVTLSMTLNTTNLTRRLMLTCEVKQAVRWDGMLERLHIYDKEALTASITFFSFSSLKDAIEGFFDKVANSTKKITEWIS